MKKILSLTLAALMVVSMVPTAFAADVDYQNGTEVEYTGSRTTVNADGTETHNAEYTITVPALLAPGGSGTVTLQGMWPSDATVKVTAEDKVEMVNNINSADKKELAVTFTAIELAGNNTVAVSDDETVSVADISNALFGTWSGKFNYNVEYNGEAGGSGTVTPTPDPDDGGAVEPGEGQIRFTIDGVQFLADEGMTWEQWIKSEYNTNVITQNGTEVRVIATNTPLMSGASGVYTNHEIKENTAYTAYVADEPAANLITFTIDGKSYQAEENMNFVTWVDTDYNTDGYKVSEDKQQVENSNGSILYVVGEGNRCPAGAYIQPNAYEFRVS